MSTHAQCSNVCESKQDREFAGGKLPTVMIVLFAPGIQENIQY